MAHSGTVLGLVIGALLATLVAIIRAQWNSYIKQEDKRRTRQYNVYSDLVSAYNDTKRFRRLLRAKGILRTKHEIDAETKEVLRSDYDEQMASLNDTQLQLEFYCRYLKSNQAQFNDFPDVDRLLRPAKDYLGKLVKEYEDSRSLFSGEPLRCELRQLPELEDCLRPYKESKNYAENFKEPFKELLTEIESIHIGGVIGKKLPLGKKKAQPLATS